ncbi:dsDNA nuclease domain-containing protein [Amycolatopsis sp., V23-08]|uniref:DsDNA nuclease domain-containing protein n=1 Tax=Amycolatopsis heterodermiae TaxID=3110235 RepID=A0ABU5R972_9PSEU|nr:dsDNA nuclease domain-containing protein [Amycolatopsis sp., V23-08]MEA5362798.1 dsDNA nuclease domain-containing protein [Amycolatopsis sp., V23-08]
MSNLPEDAQTSPVLDSAQLVRIEATHRGFGYQHLYAVACLLTMDRTDTDEVVIEHDEDVELVRPSGAVYVQVKTRERPLRFSDLDGVLPRFEQLRRAHAGGERVGDAGFAIVSNAAPGPDLRARIASSSWPSDVALVWPGGTAGGVDLSLPTPWKGLQEAMEACVELAGGVPFPSLAPETLVLKLAGLAQYIATGHAGHAVTKAQLHEFLEQLVVQLHDFPQPPVDYRQQSSEPDLSAPGRVQLVVGVSGAGKTTWASIMSLRHPFPTAYFDVGELPSQAVASSLARELVARFLPGRTPGGGGAALPAASGLELMAFLSRRLREEELEVTVVLDNVHRLSAQALRSLVEAAPDVRFVLLGQPWPGQAPVEALLEIQAEELGGWSQDDVAAVFAAEGCPVEVTAVQRLLRLTAGVPLYVKAAVQLAVRAYDRDVTEFLDAVEARLTHVETAQEVILAETFKELTLPARTVASMLELADVPLTTEEALDLVSTAGLTPPTAAATVRDLTRSSILQVTGDGIKIHDAFRLLARDHRTTLEPEILSAALENLVVLVQRSLPTTWTVGRFGLWLRLLPQTGRQETLIDIATQEEFHQAGDPSEVRAAIEAIAQSTDLGDEARFWALDALAFWDYSVGSYGNIPSMVDQMTAAVGAGMDPRAASALAMKQMIAASLRDDRDGVEAAFSVGLERSAGDAMVQLIVRYNHALSLYHLGANEDAASEALSLVGDYYERLGLDLRDVVGVSPSDLRAAVPDSATRDDDFRHVADSLQLVGAASKRLGESSAARVLVHAMKFYSAASAWRSAVRVGQDAIDEVLGLGDLQGARNISENFLLPLVAEYQLVDLLIPVRAQYAVLLAWCGEIDAAREEITKLEAYQLNDAGAAELVNQRQVIDRIAERGDLAANPVIEG